MATVFTHLYLLYLSVEKCEISSEQIVQID